MSTEPVHAPFGQICESCGMRAQVALPDGSWWCRACDDAAERLGYDEIRDDT